MRHWQKTEEKVMKQKSTIPIWSDSNAMNTYVIRQTTLDISNRLKKTNKKTNTTFL